MRKPYVGYGRGEKVVGGPRVRRYGRRYGRGIT